MSSENRDFQNEVDQMLKAMGVEPGNVEDVYNTRQPTSICFANALVGNAQKPSELPILLMQIRSISPMDTGGIEDDAPDPFIRSWDPHVERDDRFIFQPSAAKVIYESLLSAAFDLEREQRDHGETPLKDMLLTHTSTILNRMMELTEGTSLTKLDVMAAASLQSHRAALNMIADMMNLMAVGEDVVESDVVLGLLGDAFDYYPDPSTILVAMVQIIMMAFLEFDIPADKFVSLVKTMEQHFIDCADSKTDPTTVLFRSE